MNPRPPPPPVEPKPMLPIPYRAYPQEPLNDTIQRFLALAETGSSFALINESYSLVLATIDPVTGDSVLHRAAAVGNVEEISYCCPACVRRAAKKRPREERLLWVLIVHQNLAGNTALHAAARTNNLRGAKAIYRLFHGDKLDVDIERRGLDPDSSIPPAEERDLYDPDDVDYALPSLAFIYTKNYAGRDAAAEARAAGHEDLAAWFDSLAQRLDHANIKKDENYLEEARQAALKNHWYYDERKNQDAS